MRGRSERGTAGRQNTVKQIEASDVLIAPRWPARALSSVVLGFFSLGLLEEKNNF